MLCKNNSACENLCCAFCNTENCVFRCYKTSSGCSDFLSKKFPKAFTFPEDLRFKPIPAPKGTKYTEKPSPKELQKLLLSKLKRECTDDFNNKYKYDEKVYAEMLEIQKMNAPDKRYSDLSKEKIVERLKEYEIKFSTLSKKEELRQLLVNCEESGVSKKVTLEEPKKRRGRKPKDEKK